MKRYFTPNRRQYRLWINKHPLTEALLENDLTTLQKTPLKTLKSHRISQVGTLLHLAVGITDDKKILGFLLGCINPYYLYRGESSLYEAMRSGNGVFLEMVEQSKQWKNETYRDEKSLLAGAFTSKDRGFIKMIYDKGYRLSAYDKKHLKFLLSIDNPTQADFESWVKLGLDVHNPTVISEFIGFAVQFYGMKELEFWMKYPMDLTYQKSKSLHFGGMAIMYGKEPIAFLKALVKKGYSLEFKNRLGESTLALALKYKRDALIPELIALGADPTVPLLITDRFYRNPKTFSNFQAAQTYMERL